jgi:uncharacterized paraquat-inducible protein A
MSAISISIGLLIALFAIWLLDRMRRLKPQVPGFGSHKDAQRMCPSCGLITSRSRTCCLECGKSLTVVSVTQIVEK